MLGRLHHRHQRGFVDHGDEGCPARQRWSVTSLAHPGNDLNDVKFAPSDLGGRPKAQSVQEPPGAPSAQLDTSSRDLGSGRLDVVA
jgi:hypothetical protein